MNSSEVIELPVFVTTSGLSDAESLGIDDPEVTVEPAHVVVDKIAFWYETDEDETHLCLSDGAQLTVALPYKKLSDCLMPTSRQRSATLDLSSETQTN